MALSGTSFRNTRFRWCHRDSGAAVQRIRSVHCRKLCCTDRTVAIAAVGANSSVIGVILNLFIGLSLGSNVVIANAIGRGDKNRWNRQSIPPLWHPSWADCWLPCLRIMCRKPVPAAAHSPMRSCLTRFCTFAFTCWDFRSSFFIM